jgi:hypothetical protein
LIGKDRFQTAADVASHLTGHLLAGPPGGMTEQDNRGSFGIASGTTYADALTGGAAMAVEHAPILLTARDFFPADTAKYLTTMTGQPAPNTFDADFFGGPAAISPALESSLDAKIRH